MTHGKRNFKDLSCKKFKISTDKIEQRDYTLVKDWKFGPWQVFGLWGRKVYFKVLITV